MSVQPQWAIPQSGTFSPSPISDCYPPSDFAAAAARSPVPYQHDLLALIHMFHTSERASNESQTPYGSEDDNRCLEQGLMQAGPHRSPVLLSARH